MSVYVVNELSGIRRVIVARDNILASVKIFSTAPSYHVYSGTALSVNFFGLQIVINDITGEL